MNITENLSQYLNTKIKDATPFEDDICGIWVSDLCFDIKKDAIPYLVMEISKNETGNYDSKILPYCTFATRTRMYQGNSFNYTPVSSEGTGSSYIAQSYSDTVIPATEIISFAFGNQKFNEGISEGAVKTISTTMDNVAESAAQQAAYDIDDPTTRMITLALIDIGNNIAKLIPYWLSLDTKRSIHIATNMERIFPGCAQLNLVTTNIVERSDGYEKESADSVQMKMYKLYPEYNITFADKGNELFGYRQFSESEIKKSDGYEHLKALKDHSYFNRQSYKNLEQKIVDYCWTKSEENPNMKVMAALCMESFEHAKKGLFELNYENADGSFQGWMDMQGKKSGKGVLTSNSGYKYVGAFENDHFSFGTITRIDKQTGTTKEEYTGNFVNNKFDGDGILSYADGRFLKGKWRKGEFKEGDGSYDGGVFTGKWKVLKKEAKTVPTGKGTLVKPDGETITGTWKNGVLATKK